MREGCHSFFDPRRTFRYPSIEAVKLSQLHANHEVKTRGHSGIDRERLRESRTLTLDGISWSR